MKITLTSKYLADALVNAAHEQLDYEEDLSKLERMKRHFASLTIFNLSREYVAMNDKYPEKRVLIMDTDARTIGFADPADVPKDILEAPPTSSIKLAVDRLFDEAELLLDRSIFYTLTDREQKQALIIADAIDKLSDDLTAVTA